MSGARRNTLIIGVIAGMMLLCLSAWSVPDAYGASKAKPGKVASLDLVVTGQPTAQLQWKKATGNANGYTIYRNGKALVKVNGKAMTAYSDETLKPGKSYTYTVKPYYKNKKGKLTYGKASPAKKVIKGYTYKKASGAATLTGYTGRAATVTTPAKIGGFKVKKIGDSCFRGNVWIKRVRISEGVTGLGKYSFESCGYLKSASLPESVRTIGDGAFNGCAQLRVCDMPEGVTSIGKGAFLYCSRLAYADLPANLNKMGDFAYAGCWNLKEVSFGGNKLTRIPDRAFYTCWSLEEARIPKSVTSIGKRAFSGCGKLVDVFLSSKSVDVGDYAFERCERMKLNVDEAGSMTIGFGEFSQLRDDFQQEHVKDQWKAEDSFIFPDDTTFADGAFFGSTVAGIVSYGTVMERGTSFQNYILEDGVLYTKDRKTLVAYFPMKLKENSPDDQFEKTESAKAGVFTVPEGVEKIAPYAFYRSRLAKVNLASTTKEVGQHAFMYSNVQENNLMIPEGSSVHVEDNAFEEWEIPGEDDDETGHSGDSAGGDSERGSSGTDGRQTDSGNGSGTDDQQTDSGSGSGTDSQQTDSSSGSGTDDQQTDSGDESDPATEPVEVFSFKDESLAGGGIFNEKKFSGYLNYNDDFKEWAQKYLKYNKNNVPMTAEAMPYIYMYTGEDHYRQMTSVLNSDTYKTQQSIARSGDDYRDMYLMVDHGLFAELSRGRMPENLLLYSGITPERVSEIAGETEKGTGAITAEQRQKIIGRIGGTVTDSAIMSTTASPMTAFNFSGGEHGSNTLIQIYGSKKAMDRLGAICVDEFSRVSAEKEIIFNANAKYRILDVGTMNQYVTKIDPITKEVISTEQSDQRTYVKVQLLEP